MSFSWYCPYCKQYTTITSSNFSNNYNELRINTRHGYKCVHVTFIVCPNPDCQEYTIYANLYDAEYFPHTGAFRLKSDSIKQTWPLKPNSKAKVFPDYIPAALISDYQEACAILDLSPKSSATLARRCLQGMIRDFWAVRIDRPNLKKEIDAIQEKVDPLVWEAIDAVREVGNIGAHMEQDVNQIIDIDSGEAEKLIGLIEMLFEEWYINRHTREQRLKNIKEVAQQKEQLKDAFKEE